jgi:hypothetical protein
MPWLQNTASEAVVSPAVLDHLRTFGSLSRMRRILLYVLACHVKGGEATKLLANFYSIDQDHR